MPTTYAIPNGRTVMDATLYTGNGYPTSGTQTITNTDLGTVGFKPDLIWIKSRSTTDYHNLNDSVRGIVGTGSPNLFSNTTDAETTFTGYGVSAITSTGFTLIGNGSYTNNNGTTYVGWQWQAGQGTSSTNTSGSITSTVSVSKPSGFSIITYTGTGSAATVGHGLGVTPYMIIVKERSTARDWPVWHNILTGGQALFLNSTLATLADTAVWNNTLPTSSVFSVSTSTYTNQSTGTYVAYCWTPIAGYSAFGSYVGNGSSDGTFVYTGFRPKFVMFKRTDSAGSWILLDSSRSTYNAADAILYPNLSNIEDGGRAMDFLSNGFKFRQGTYDPNVSGGTYIYMAFAENPFKNVLAR